MSDLVDLLTTAIWSEIGDKLHTCIPATVTKYNKTDCTIEAAPLVDKVFNDGTVIRFKPIVQIPVVFPRTKRFKMSYPLEAGDGVLLLFAERCIDEWVLNGDYSTPDNPRIFKMTDAIAIPGLFGIKAGKPINSDKEFELEFDDVKMTSDGKKWTIVGDMEVTGEVTANNKKLSTHVHPGASLVVIPTVAAFNTPGTAITSGNVGAPI